ncbi:hypothetical protein M758_12G004900 [Ceratodon purpureus]|uniref:Uncharacterized protein n=1 Tax=Ceratodon purpureus TaxID=3225 RepID=A0A8T0G265_CERPU|nr:hypothetical protein KC19_12G004600 [Ceratodon purpureus]KAG0597565.1 hypothetical protein M758_12G004900 [Ceratodon purpureus]
MWLPPLPLRPLFFALLDPFISFNSLTIQSRPHVHHPISSDPLTDYHGIEHLRLPLLHCPSLPSSCRNFWRIGLARDREKVKDLEPGQIKNWSFLAYVSIR